MQNRQAIRAPGCLLKARAASESAAEPRSRAGYAHVVPPEIGAPDMIEQRRPIDARRQWVATPGAFPEQDPRARQAAVERARMDVAVTHRAPEAAMAEFTVA